LHIFWFHCVLRQFYHCLYFFPSFFVLRIITNWKKTEMDKKILEYSQIFFVLCVDYEENIQRWYVESASTKKILRPSLNLSAFSRTETRANTAWTTTTKYYTLQWIFHRIKSEDL
jgi:hypothetical protein